MKPHDRNPDLQKILNLVKVVAPRKPGLADFQSLALIAPTPTHHNIG